MIHNREEKYEVKLPWWQHFRVLATFLDRDGQSALSNDGRNVWATVLFLSAIMYMKVRHVNFFLPYLQDHSLLGSRHFATMAT